jgi:hypothetical protein
MLQLTSSFLLQRYLGYTTLSSLFAEDASAYGVDEAPWHYVEGHEWPYPVESIQATYSANKSCFTEVRYAPHLLLAHERLFFEPTSLRVRGIQTTYSSDAGAVPRRLTSCAGPEDPNAVAALRSLRVLDLACRFLKADVCQDLATQGQLLADDAVAFGVRGKEAIVACQQEGIEGGTTYSVPFPVQVNPDAQCVTLDFYAHKGDNKGGESKQRGTDIMYVDVREGKVLRIDTLRHALEQPAWVKAHFST